MVSAEGWQISIKTVTSSHHISFNRSTFDAVHRVVILRLNFDDDDISIEEVADMPASDFLPQCRESEGVYIYSPRQRHASVPVADQKPVRQASYGPYKVREYESGTIQVEKDGVPEKIAKPALRDLATSLGVSLVNNNGNPRNTRQLGSEILVAMQTLDKSQ